MVKHVSVLAHGTGNPQQPQPSPVRQIRPFLEGTFRVSGICVFTPATLWAGLSVDRLVG